jgi:translation initiation factor 1
MADKVVFSTDPGFRQPDPVKLSFQRGGKGSGVTRVEKLSMHPTLKEQLLTRLKKRLGCGGTIKDGVLELQGDRRDFVEAELAAQGYKVKRTGGP